MLSDIAELRTFVCIASEGSLSAAARTMGLALSVVSKRLATLERRTGTRLMARSTRRLSLTDEGSKLFERAQRILAEVDEAEAMLHHGRIEPQGLLRISAPIALGRAHVSPVCRDLALANPGVTVDLVLTDRVSGVIEEGFDVAIRIGPPKSSDLVIRKLADNHRIVVASPAYLASHDAPLMPEDLTGHDCFHHGAGSVWSLVGPAGRRVDVAVDSRFRCNNGEIWHDWAVDGAGLAMKSRIDVAADIRSGRLVHILPDWCSPPAPICALLPGRTLVPLRVRLFLEAMSIRLRTEPI